MSKNCLALAGCILLTSTLAATATINTPIRTEIIAGREVTDIEVIVKREAQRITVSGTGFEVFPNRTCGYPEITFVGTNGRILLQKDAVYELPESLSSRPANFVRSRFVKFSLTVPICAPVAVVVVRHQSTGGCGHDWSLQYALDWVLDKIFPFHR
jgi:hypothetical protein